MFSFKKIYLIILMLIALFSCQRTGNKVQESPQTINDPVSRNNDKKGTAMETAKTDIIVDCNYTFAEATAGTKAPDSIISNLKLITVEYYSTDGKIHRGQVLTNRRIADEIEEIFKFILQQKFPVYQVIPAVKYDWNDERSMEANNSYSFCYRDISYSKHATGMAIDINPFFNPVRWKEEYSYRKNKPEGAVYNPEVPGTFYETQPVVEKFKEMGFKWGHYFSRNHDDHHFEKINYK